MTAYEKFRSMRYHLDFYKNFWRKQEELKIGLHTIAICNEIDKAIEKFDGGRGESSFIIITVPPRHGKSDLISRYLPAHFIGLYPDCDVMLTTYSASLAFGFSKDARAIVADPRYTETFHKTLSFKNSAVDSWQLDGHVGTVNASGLVSGLTGKGYHLGILDDYCAGRADAESQVMRDKAWDSFTNDFMTRRAPCSITFILATPWHVDDIIGRIKSINDPSSDRYDEHFPKFKVLSFPAKDGECDVEINGEVEHFKYDYLFTDKTLKDGSVLHGRMTPLMYEQQFAILGQYSAQALMQCNPTVRGGNLIDCSKIKYHSNINDFPAMRYYRVWDLAHSEKERMKDDPDWTSGTLLAYKKVRNPDGTYFWELWIRNVARIRANAPERDAFIRSVAEKDGQNVPIIVEQSIDSKDMVTTMRAILRGRRIVKGIKLKGDKVSRMSFVEPIFDAGNVHVYRDEWNLDWVKEVKEFPSGKHDDQVDNMSAGYNVCCQSQMNSQLIGVNGI